MSGLRRVFIHAGLGLSLLTGCSNKLENSLPIAGEGQRSDSAAQELFAKAQASAQAGKTKSAIKNFRNVAEQYPNSPLAAEARFQQASLLEQDGELLDAFDAYQLVIQRYQGSALYAKARDRQAFVAHAAADGIIKNNFLGLKSRLESKKIAEMLETVRDNAPQAPSAPRAQFTIGQVRENRKEDLEAIEAYQQVVDDYPRSSYAPDAQFRIGNILLAGAAGGDQDNANLDRALHTFEDLRQSFPGSKRATEATTKIAEIKSRDVQRNFEIGEFYYKKGQTTSAALYYKEVISKTTSGELHDRATARLSSIGSPE